MTYSVISRNPNSWTQNHDGSGRVYEIQESCGHKHRTILGAVKCFGDAENTTLGLGWPEDNSTGEGISDAEHNTARQQLHERGL